MPRGDQIGELRQGETFRCFYKDDTNQVYGIILDNNDKGYAKIPITLFEKVGEDTNLDDKSKEVNHVLKGEYTGRAEETNSLIYTYVFYENGTFTLDIHHDDIGVSETSINGTYTFSNERGDYYLLSLDYGGNSYRLECYEYDDRIRIFGDIFTGSYYITNH